MGAVIYLAYSDINFGMTKRAQIKLKFYSIKRKKEMMNIYNNYSRHQYIFTARKVYSSCNLGRCFGDPLQLEGVPLVAPRLHIFQ